MNVQAVEDACDLSACILDIVLEENTLRVRTSLDTNGYTDLGKIKTRFDTVSWNIATGLVKFIDDLEFDTVVIEGITPDDKVSAWVKTPADLFKQWNQGKVAGVEVCHTLSSQSEVLS